MAITRIVMPATAKRGEVVEIKTIIQHEMETGYRRTNDGRPIPRRILTSFVVTAAEEEVFAAEMTQGIAANPFWSFPLTATETTELVFAWTDETGEITRVTRPLTVT